MEATAGKMKVFGVGQIAGRIPGCGVNDVRYIVRHRRIKPIGRAGHVLIYGEKEFREIRKAYRETYGHRD